MAPRWRSSKTIRPPVSYRISGGYLEYGNFNHPADGGINLY